MSIGENLSLVELNGVGCERDTHWMQLKVIRQCRGLIAVRFVYQWTPTQLLRDLGIRVGDCRT